MKAITANRLLDGAVVWYGPDGGWVETLDAAAVFEDSAADAALATAKQGERDRVVVDVYAIDVALTDGCPVAVRVREKIRALGPTVRTDLGKQAAALQSQG